MSYQNEALKCARETIKQILSGIKNPEFSFSHEIFNQHLGVFVTLKKHEELRGCIGYIQGFEPLGQAIQKMATAAALHDSRFSPVTVNELDEIVIEISVLSELIEVKDISEIKIGRDGLLLKKGPFSGVLLPQVPVEWNWDVNEFLCHLCLKAGLPEGSHLTAGARLERFEAEIFSEKG